MDLVTHISSVGALVLQYRVGKRGDIHDEACRRDGDLEGALRGSWATNFTPVKVSIGYTFRSAWHECRFLTDGLSGPMSEPLSYDQTIEGEMTVQAYLGMRVSEYVSADFHVRKIPRKGA